MPRSKVIPRVLELWEQRVPEPRRVHSDGALDIAKLLRDAADHVTAHDGAQTPVYDATYLRGVMLQAVAELERFAVAIADLDRDVDDLMSFAGQCRDALEASQEAASEALTLVEALGLHPIDRARVARAAQDGADVARMLGVRS